MNSIISIRMDNLNLKKESDIRQKFLKGISVNLSRDRINEVLRLSSYFGSIGEPGRLWTSYVPFTQVRNHSKRR